MECVAICRLCGIRITFERDNAFPLGKHLFTAHPDLEMAHFFFDDVGESDDLSSSEQALFFDNSTKNNQLIVNSSLFRNIPNLCRSAQVSKTVKRHNLFKTTVETWSPGGDALVCPNCATNDQPYIRKQRHKVANNPLGAFCLLGCWPLCFMPMIMSNCTSTMVCCRSCGYSFGSYDEKTGQLVPTNKQKGE